MSLKCSILGHRFDDRTVERDREEEGTEVVITVTETETCSRCGESRIVSENKEITTLETPDQTSVDAADDGAGSAGTSDSVPDAEPTDGTSEQPRDDAEILDDSADESTAQADARSDPGTDIPDAAGEAVASESVVEEDDDAVIIDGEGSDGDATTASTTQSDETASEPAAQQTATATEGSSERSADVGGDVETDDAEWPEEPEKPDSAMSEAADAEWPEETEAPQSAAGTGEAMSEWPDETKRDADLGGDEQVDFQPTDGATVTVPEGMFKCSECGFTTEVASSPLRAGDYCPECHRGEIVQHDDADAR